ncbi:GNAT family N-acetyltransferase [Tolypothrix campylonemoides VB511288]|nr:GNAT family N-acetyltransferase [Tolypothrix campylonemoides VB511288]
MAGLRLRDATEADVPRIAALNAAEVAQTSAMDLERLRTLHALACHHRVAERDGDVVAFLLAMDHAAAYVNDTFAWFAAREPRFVYVDRIGGALYRDLFDAAHAAGIDRVVCEYNLDPPNPASQAFHARFGFVEVGRQRVAGGKRVSMQRKLLAGA